jgi:hypothetical protein
LHRSQKWMSMSRFAPTGPLGRVLPS